MFISPNFEINDDQNSEIISAISKEGKVDEFLYAENVKVGGKPLHIAEDIDRDRVLLASLSDNVSMWLYPDGKIKTER